MSLDKNACMLLLAADLTAIIDVGDPVPPVDVARARTLDGDVLQWLDDFLDDVAFEPDWRHFSPEIRAEINLALAGEAAAEPPQKYGITKNGFGAVLAYVLAVLRR